MSKNKPTIYMGAYSMKDWIDKILNKEILLPPYQRSFVWDYENKGKNFIDSLKREFYIPPVTLGEYDGKTYLIDGQQRLTTLLCIKYKIWPQDNKSNKTNEEDETPKLFSEFTFNDIQEAYSENKSLWKEHLLAKNVIDSKDGSIESISEDETFIPYCHIMWTEENKKKEFQQEFYSETFNRINMGGEALTSKEVRQALYWIHEDKNLSETVFNRNFENSIQINYTPLDYISYLSILFAKEENRLKGYSRSNDPRFSQYISDYILFLTKTSADFKILKIWDDTYRSKITKDNYDKFQAQFTLLQKTNFDNITQADYYFFGLIYYIYNGYQIKPDIVPSTICEKLDSYSQNMNKSEDGNYQKRANKLVRVRSRVLDSIEQWREFVEKINTGSSDG